VLGLAAAETPAALDNTDANSPRQRARATLAEQGPPGDTQPVPDMDLDSELRDGFIDADERADAETSIALMHENIRITMPPYGLRYDGREATAPLLEAAFGEESMGEWRLIRADCIRMPAAISYVQRPGDGEFRAFKAASSAPRTARFERSRPSASTCERPSACPRCCTGEAGGERRGDNPRPDTPPWV
jgi:hypothetical protein